MTWQERYGWLSEQERAECVAAGFNPLRFDARVCGREMVYAPMPGYYLPMKAAPRDEGRKILLWTPYEWDEYRTEQVSTCLKPDGSIDGWSYFDEYIHLAERRARGWLPILRPFG